MKILFTSVGRRVELIQAFRYAAEKIGIRLIIIGADITDTAPAMLFCDKTIIVPRINDAAYIPYLVKYCIENSVDALIPTIDTDLMLLAKNKDKFGKTKVFISSLEKISLCRDKRLTADYFHSLGLKSPTPVDDIRNYQDGFPAFIKPKDGSSSIFAYKVENREELYATAKQVPDYIVQPFISGTEYTVDVFCGYDGTPVLITPRFRLAVRAGEVLKTQIAQDEQIISEIKRLVADYKPCGQITVQLIREEKTGDDYFIEINPRFGGGAPLSMKAGADSAEMILRLLNGEQLRYIEYAAENGAVYSRFDQSVRVK